MLRELQALCKSHGLPAGGSNADLAARLAAALPSGWRGGAEEKVAVAAEGVVGKGCLKRSGGGGASGVGGFGPAKKVTFVLEEEAEAETGARRRSRRLRR